MKKISVIIGDSNVHRLLRPIKQRGTDRQISMSEMLPPGEAQLEKAPCGKSGFITLD